MNDAAVAPLPRGQSALFENGEHRRVLRKDVCFELCDSSILRDARQMTEQARSDAAALVVLLDDECDFRGSLADGDVTRRSDDDVARRRGGGDHERNFVLEVDVHSTI